MSPSEKNHRGKRRMARELAVQMLYQHDQGGSRVAEVIGSFRSSEGVDETSEGEPRRPASEDSLSYARVLVEGAVENRSRVDDLIEAAATNWRLVRMPAVDRSILRVAVYELLFESDVPRIVVVDEAIELAKRFGSEQSPSFINGVLDGLLQSDELPDSLLTSAGKPRSSGG